MNIYLVCVFFFFFKQKTAYEIYQCDWSSDVCSSDLGGKPLLERHFVALENVGIRDVIVVVGYESEQITTRWRSHHREVSIRYIHNEDYKQGSILSLWKAREEFTDDVLIMDADVLFPIELLDRLVSSCHASCCLVDEQVDRSAEEMMLIVRGGRAMDILRRIAGPLDCIGEGVGFFKLARRDAEVLGTILDRFITLGKRGLEYEEAIAMLMQQIELFAERVGDLPWTEIDFPEDVERAEHDILPKIKKMDQAWEVTR